MVPRHGRGGGVPSKFFLKKLLLGFTTDPLGRRKQIFGNLFPFGNVPCKIQLVPKTASNDLCQNRFPRRADEHHICPREKHGCAVKQASAVPRKNFLCCGMLRHAAACCGMLQPALVGTYTSVSS